MRNPIPAALCVVCLVFSVPATAGRSGEGLPYDCGPLAAATAHHGAGDPLLAALAPLVEDANPSWTEMERGLAAAEAADPERLELDTRLLAQSLLFRFTSQHERKFWRNDPRPRAAKQVMRFALPAEIFAAIGHEPDPTVESWLGSADAWTERVTTFCGNGNLLVHERLLEGLAFRPVRAGDTRALVGQVIAFDETGAAHVTPIVERVEMRRGLAEDAPACVAHLDLDDGGSPGIVPTLEDIHPDRFVFRMGDGIGCNGCHSNPHAFDVKDVPDPTEARTLLDARRARVEAAATERLRFFLASE